MNKTIIIPTTETIGLDLKGQIFKRNSMYFDFAEFPKGTEYPIVYNIDKKSLAYEKGLRIGDKIIKLNGFSLYCKDISTVICDFEYEKKNSKYLTIVYI